MRFMGNTYPETGRILDVRDESVHQGVDFSLPTVPWGYYAAAVVLGFDAR